MIVPRSTLFIGGARSGKSRLAQCHAENIEGQHLFLATAEAFDEEMHDRIARHQSDRDVRWRTVESPINLPEAIVCEGGPEKVVLVDCLTLWASNLLLAGHDFNAATARLVDAITMAEGAIVLVTNEVGSGIVPDNKLARQFRDVAGRMNQEVAATVHSVQFVVAGLALKIR